LSTIGFAAHNIQCCGVLGHYSSTTADLDGDGDMDVLSAVGWGDHYNIAWYENRDGKGGFGEQKVITTRAPGANSVTAVDVDGDGDMDVLSGSFAFDYGDARIAWYQNTDGKGTFDEQQVITTGDLVFGSVTAADVDGDGDLDFLSTYRNRVAWHEQRLVGDANDDGVFNSSDLLRILQAGEYEDGIVLNSTFEEGDWNGDGEFDRADLVLALQAGHYERGAQASLAALTAAVDWLLADNHDDRLGLAFIS
jgi:hypothetical protein